MSRFPMNRRRLALASIAVVTVLCVVGVAILAVAAGGSALAYEVNGTRVSQTTVDGQLDALANNKLTRKQSATTKGAVDSKITAQVLTLNVARDVMRDSAERRGVKLTAADRSAARQALGANVDQYPSSYADLAVDVQAYAKALGLADSNAINAYLGRQFKRAHVYVDPKYGFWNPRFGVCPPTGCASLSTGSGSGTG